jgi:IS605 OrfB family transposase
LVGRLSIQKQRRELQKNLKFTQGGRGRNKKMEKLNSLGTKERNYIKNQNHIISKEVIRLALQNKCYAINIEDLSGIGKSQKNSFILRNWSYFELQSMIKNKATAVGIKVNVIDPKYSSQRCSKCGHIHEDNRDTQSEFVCQECGFEDNADFNASKNISIADTKEYKDEIKKYLKKIDKKVDDLDF